ncbi:MAG: glycosyltransferase family 39 protein [Chloroflexota bacterium]
MTVALSSPVRSGRGVLAARLVVVGLAVLALALRAYRLGAQSLWYDEGISVAVSGRGLLQITRDALADIHPPVYYYVLHFWTGLTGNSEFSLRYVSATASACAVLLVYQLGRHLFSSGAGVAAAALLATSPLAIYYGQETRSYSLLLALTALWTLVLVRAEPGDSHQAGGRPGRRWFGYIALGVVAVYTHYIAFLVLAAHAAWCIIALARRPGRIVYWLSAQFCVGLAFVPWFLNMSFGQLESFRRGASQPGSTELLLRILDDFTVGHLALPDEAARAAVLALALLGLISAPLVARRGWRAGGLALLYLLVPVIVILAISTRRPVYQARLLLEAAPGLYLLAGAGVAAAGTMLARLLAPWCVGGVIGIVVSGLMLGFALSPLATTISALYFDTAWHRDDFRAAVREIETNARPEDAIVLDSPGQVDLFRYYFRGPQAVYPLPAQLPIDTAKTEAELALIAERHPSVWAILWGESEPDPDRVVERWLDTHAFKTTNPWYGGIRLARYVVSSVGQRHDVNVSFGDNVRLLGYAWQSQSGQAGDVLPLTLYWEASATLDKNYVVFVHILDEKEKIWGQRDSEPGGGARPTSSWPVGQVIEDRIGLPIQKDAAPGSYQVELGMYYPPTMERPPLHDAENRPLGNRLLIGPVAVK